MTAPAPRRAPEDAGPATRLSVRDTARLAEVSGLIDGALLALHDDQDTLRHYLSRARTEVDYVRGSGRG